MDAMHHYNTLRDTVVCQMRGNSIQSQSKFPPRTLNSVSEEETSPILLRNFQGVRLEKEFPDEKKCPTFLHIKPNISCISFYYSCL